MDPGQSPEGPVRELADVVSLEPEHLQTVKSLERQALDDPNAIPIQVPKREEGLGLRGHAAHVPRLHLFPRRPSWVPGQQGETW